MADEKCVRDPRHDCFGLEAAGRLEERVKNLEKWRDESQKFHEDFYKDQKDRAERDGKIDEQLSNMNKDMAEVKSDVKQVLETQRACAQKSGGRWESIKDKVIVGVMTSVLTAGVLALLVLSVNNL